MLPPDGWRLEAGLYSPDTYFIEVGSEMLARRPSPDKSAYRNVAFRPLIGCQDLRGASSPAKKVYLAEGQVCFRKQGAFPALPPTP